MLAERYFRYPNQLETTGEAARGRGIFIGNPDISPEYSYQLEWRLSGKRSSFSYQLNSWYTYFQGRISEVPQDNGTFTYENLDNARNMGVEIVFNKKIPLFQASNGASANAFAHLLDLSITGTAIVGDELAEGLFSEAIDPLLGVPPARLSLMARYTGPLVQGTEWSVHSKLDRVSEFSRFPGGFNNQTFGIEEAPAYWLLGIGVEVEKQIGIHSLQLGVNATNLTNSNYFPFGTRVMEMGRNFQFNLRWSL